MAAQGEQAHFSQANWCLLSLLLMLVTEWGLKYAWGGLVMAEDPVQNSNIL